MDPRQLQRFQNEARAAASLQHPHIVPVYGVGCERGVHYYAMQFIDGQSLERLLQTLRQAGEPTPTSLGQRPPAGSTVDETKGTEPVPPSLSPSQEESEHKEGSDREGEAPAEPRSAPSDRGYFRRVA